MASTGVAEVPGTGDGMVAARLLQSAGWLIDRSNLETRLPPRIDLEILRRLPDKTIILGVIDNGGHEAESPEVVADRIRDALQHVSPERLIPAPDCGMKYMSRELALAKLSALVAGAAIVREELQSQ